jgi:hypothetical protein
MRRGTPAPEPQGPPAEIDQRNARQAGDRPRRECAHRGQPHRHGTRAAYVKDRCRCAACTAANTAASRAAARDRALGVPSGFVDVAEVRAHLQTLRAAGIGYQQIARLAGTSVTHLREISHTVVRSGNRPPIRRIRRELAATLLGIAPVAANRAPQSQLEATGTRRRLQALIAAGWPEPELAAQLGRTLTNLRRTMSSRTVTTRTAQRVEQLYRELSTSAPPVVTDAQREASAAARALGTRRGWLPPLAWDDIDTDPEPDPPRARRDPREIDPNALSRAAAGGATRLGALSAAEQAAIVRHLTQRGRSVREVAQQLATTQRTVARYRQPARGIAHSPAYRPVRQPGAAYPTTSGRASARDATTGFSTDRRRRLIAAQLTPPARPRDPASRREQP